MALGQRDEPLAADWVRFRELTTSGKSEEAFRLAEENIAQSRDPFEVAQAHLERGHAYYGARDWDALLPVVKQIEEALPAAPHPRLVGQYHTLTGVIALCLPNIPSAHVRRRVGTRVGLRRRGRVGGCADQ